MAPKGEGLMNKRPMPVSFLCLGNGVLAIFLIAASLMAENRGYAPWQAAISGLSGLGISLSAHGCWFGYRLARNALLALLTLFLGLVVLQSLLTLIWAMNTGYQGALTAASFTRFFLSLAWLVVNYAVLLGKQGRTFFK